MENTYCIIKTEDISKCNFDLLVVDDNNLRKTKDGSKCIIEWQGQQPAFINNIEVIGIYTHEEILEVTQSDEWQSELINFTPNIRGN